MRKPKSNYFQRRTKFQGPRTNERIRSLDVQVINSTGENLGVLPIKKAIEKRLLLASIIFSIIIVVVALLLYNYLKNF